MARGFLPPPVPGAEHPVPQSPRGAFASGDAPLLGKVGVNMAVAKARTEGRVPSPASRAYMFYAALFSRALAMEANPTDEDEAKLAGEGREHLRRQARDAFRGLCAVFALREALGLEVRLERAPLIADADAVSRALVDTFRFAPGGLAFWQPVRFFTVRSHYGGPAEVLAGLSPLTGVFPAAKPPEQALTGAFWYDPPVRRQGGNGQAPRQAVWYDPTSDRLAGDDEEFFLGPSARAAVRGALRVWVDAAIQALADDALAPLGVASRDEDLLRAELREWARELGGAPAAAAEVVQAPIPAAGGDVVPAFLQLALRGLPAHVLSDLPTHHGRLLVTARTVSDRGRRVWGRLFGRPEWAARVESLPAYGDDLGDALGLGPHAAPARFVAVDKLFTPRLTILTSGGEVSPEWGVLPVQDGPVTGYALLPFEPDILTLVSPEELLGKEGQAGRVSAELSQDKQHYIVRLRLGEEEVRRLYALGGDEAYLVDDVVPPDALDVRLFPNFDLGTVRDLLPTLPDGRRPDATYYARVRFGPNWPFGVRAFRLEGGAGAGGDGAATVPRIAYLSEPAKRGSNHLAFPEGAYPPGEALFFTLPEKPDGLYFGGRGFCLIRLRAPVAAGHLGQTWEVGVDFGTSNTCVAVRGDGAAEIPDLPVLTTTLFANPPYGAILGTNEGTSAAFDFFYKLRKSDRLLNEQAYFPTQILTQQAQLPPGQGPELDLAAGLIYFRNVNLTGADLLRLTQEFGLSADAQTRPLTQRFRLEQDIKWTRREWLRAFMAHLRKQVVLTAAARNARIRRVRFSYPRAFTSAEEGRFREEVRQAWSGHVGGEPILDPERPLLTESEAVRHSLAVDANQRVVFDLGGGTTDLIAFDAKRPVFQTSLKLAARQLNGYVAASPPFREAFAAAVRGASGELGKKLGLTLDLFQGPNRTEKEVLNGWVGLLQSLENEDAAGHTLSTVTMALQEAKDAQGRAVRGFFLSAALVFGGLAFFAGRLLRAAAAGRLHPAARAFPLTGVTLTLTGNGSKLYRILSPPGYPFGPVFEGLFREGLGLGPDDPLSTRFGDIYRLPDGRLAPKATVALGLLQQNGAAEAEVPVANVLGETLPDGAGDAESPLTAFYARIARDIALFNPPRSAPPELAAFLDALHQRLPRGMNGRHVVIPGAGTSWHEPLKGEVFARAAPGVKDRLHASVQGLGEDVDALEGGPDVPALEPLFIAELAALLDQIRQEHAT